MNQEWRSFADAEAGVPLVFGPLGCKLLPFLCRLEVLDKGLALGLLQMKGTF